MFKLFKKRNENNIKEIKQYIPSQNECTSLMKLNEKIEELKAAYTLIKNRVVKYIATENTNTNSDIGVTNSLKLFHEEVVTNIQFMTNNNENNIYSELLIEFNMLKELFEKLINDVYQQQYNLNNLNKKCK